MRVDDHPERDDKRWLNRTLVRWAADDKDPAFDYEPVGLLDLPPGDRGYGNAVVYDLEVPVEDHNAEVAGMQAAAGRLETLEPAGSRMRWGDWHRELAEEEKGA